MQLMIILPMLGPIFLTIALKSALSDFLVEGNVANLRLADGIILITYGLKSLTSTIPCEVVQREHIG